MDLRRYGVNYTVSGVDEAYINAAYVILKELISRYDNDMNTGTGWDVDAAKQMCDYIEGDFNEDIDQMLLLFPNGNEEDTQLLEKLELNKESEIGFKLMKNYIKQALAFTNASELNELFFEHIHLRYEAGLVFLAGPAELLFVLDALDSIIELIEEDDKEKESADE